MTNHNTPQLSRMDLAWTVKSKYPSCNVGSDEIRRVVGGLLSHFVCNKHSRREGKVVPSCCPGVGLGVPLKTGWKAIRIEQLSVESVERPHKYLAAGEILSAVELNSALCRVGYKGCL
jgi:hypothetical protein